MEYSLSKAYEVVECPKCDWVGLLHQTKTVDTFIKDEDLIKSECSCPECLTPVVPYKLFSHTG